MKPRNFPGRKESRKARADARAKGEPMPSKPPHVADMTWRLGPGPYRTGVIPPR